MPRELIGKESEPGIGGSEIRLALGIHKGAVMEIAYDTLAFDFQNLLVFKNSKESGEMDIIFTTFERSELDNSIWNIPKET